MKRLGPGDEEEVKRFDAAFDQPIDADRAGRYLADERHHLILAYVEGEAAGFVSGTEILHPDKATELFLSELDVIPAMRRRGVASSLLAELKRLAKERDCASIWVLTSEDNEAGMATYRSAGGSWDGANSVMFEIDPER